MIKAKAPLIAAIISAILIHLLIIYISVEKGWFHTENQSSTFKLVLLPDSEITKTPPKKHLEEAKASIESEQAQANTEKQATNLETQNPLNSTLLDQEFKKLSESSLLNNGAHSQPLEQEKPFLSDILNAPSLADKPELLDLSNIEFSPDNSDEALSGIFSDELRSKIEKSKEVQEEYLKGQVEIKEYPITEGADGVRYVNIEGVCWKVPELGSDEPWSIVLSGCAELHKSFHFELNIAPSTLLGPESPFFIGQ